MKRIVTLQDISCVGCCSITVALPVISAMGVECGILPTAVLSMHTMFKTFTCRTYLTRLRQSPRHGRRNRFRLTVFIQVIWHLQSNANKSVISSISLPQGKIWYWLIRPWRTTGSCILHSMRISRLRWRKYVRKRT